MTNVLLDLGDGIGTVTLSGGLVIVPTGIAGELTLGTALDFGSGVTIAGAFTLQINNATTAVVLPSGTRLAAGPYVRFVGTGIVLTFGTAEQLPEPIPSTFDFSTVAG